MSTTPGTALVYGPPCHPSTEPAAPSAVVWSPATDTGGVPGTVPDIDGASPCATSTPTPVILSPAMTVRRVSASAALAPPPLFREPSRECRDLPIKHGFLGVGQAVRTGQRRRRRRHRRYRGIDQGRRHRARAGRRDDGVDRGVRGVDQFFDGFPQLLGGRPR